MFKLIWWLVIGWWYRPTKAIFKFIFSSIPLDNPSAKVPDVLSFTVRSWGEYNSNIEAWQSKNAKDLWVDTTYTEKPIYHYSWKNNIPVFFVAEPDNIHDNKAIAVYLDGVQIGYVPRETNIIYHNHILKIGKGIASIHGGNRKKLDSYGDLIVEKFDPVVDVEIVNE